MTSTVPHRNLVLVTEIFLRAAGAALAFVLGVVTVVGTSSAAQAQTNETVLYTFTGGADGANPHAGLIRDAEGNLFSTTTGGGAYGSGVVFKVSSQGQETVLYNFCPKAGCADGYGPHAGVIQDADGNLYGTTLMGGAIGAGTVFKLSSQGEETVLYSFSGGTDGGGPWGGVIRDAAGNLYGTTNKGGAYPFVNGVVFKLSSEGQETVLHSFTGGADGANPYAGVTRDAKGNLYGTTQAGGAYGYGVVFKVSSEGQFTVLHNFTGGADGGNPEAAVIRDAKGNLYGTALVGGGTLSCGVVFKVSSRGHYTALHSFAQTDGCAPFAGVIRDAKGNLYGTAWGGSARKHGDAGVVFKLSSQGQETVLYSFCPERHCADGWAPTAGVIRDAAGNLYGTTTAGGSGDYGYGVVYKLSGK